jgi:hypothetical protein
MESIYFINLIFIFAVNVFFFFSGICLNSLVILSFWRSVQLLSCCDLLAVLTNSPLIAFMSMSWLTGKLDVNATWLHISIRSTGSFLVFSLFALLVINFDRYLSTPYPIFHRTSVTKRRLLTLLAILMIIVEIPLKVMTVNDFVISYQVHGLIHSILFFFRDEQDVFFEKCIELFASSRLSCGVIHSRVRLHWIKNKLARDNIYFG